MQKMDISKSKVAKYALLRHKKYRDKEGLFLVQGEKAVRDTIDSFQTEALIIKRNSPLSDKFNSEFILEATDADFRKISSLESVPEIIAVYRIPSVTSTVINDEKREFYLVLDGIQDPGNFGTIIRTAHWFGIKTIYCSPDTVDVYNPKVVLSSMGSIGKIKVIYTDLETLFSANNHIPVYGLLMNGKNLFEINNLTPGYILMGSEGHGPAEATLKHITEALTIPPANQHHRPDSLNVAVATAITLSQILK